MISCTNCMAPLDPHEERGGWLKCEYCGVTRRAPAGAGLLLRADFADPTLAGWMCADRGLLTFSLGPPPEIVCRAPAGQVVNVLASAGTFDDFEARLSVRFLEGSPAAIAGLQLRTQVGTGLYAVWFSAQGTYTISYMPWKGAATTLVPWTASPALKHGLGQGNDLRVTCQGERLTVAFNGQIASAVRDNRLAFGHLRVNLTCSKAPVAAAFSLLEVREVAAQVPVAPPAAPAPTSDLVDLVLTAIDPKRKIMAIKVVRELTRVGLAEAKNAVENPPFTLRSAISRGTADELVVELSKVGATAKLVKTPSGAPQGASDVILKSFLPNHKIQVIKAVMVNTGLGLAASKALVESCPQLVRKGASPADAELLAAGLREAGGIVEFRPIS